MMTKLGGRGIVQKSLLSLNLGVIARRKDNMYALASKVNIDCDLFGTSRREVKSRVRHWQCFERSIDSYLH